MDIEFLNHRQIEDIQIMAEIANAMAVADGFPHLEVCRSKDPKRIATYNRYASVASCSSPSRKVTTIGKTGRPWHSTSIFQFINRPNDALLRTMIATKDFPREYKYTLCQRIKDELIELVVMTLRRSSLVRCHPKIRAREREGSPVDSATLKDLSQSVSSYLGMLRQVNGHKARQSICRRVESLFFRADREFTKLKP